MRIPSLIVAFLLSAFVISDGFAADTLPAVQKPSAQTKHKHSRKHHKNKKSKELAKKSDRDSTQGFARPEIRRDIPGPGSAGEDRNYWWLQRRAWPNDDIDPAMYPAALEQARRMPKLLFSHGKYRTASELEWTSIGPTAIDGRVTSIATHPTDPNIFYVGAASGGLWRTSDHGTAWQCVTDTFGSLSIGCVAIDPVEPKTIYLGQGEPNGSADSYPGNGLWKSTDEGQTWVSLGFEQTQYISKIILDPQDHNTVYLSVPGSRTLADTTRGVFKSVDAGATWQQVLLVRAGKFRNSRPVPVIDIALNPLNSQQLLAFSWQKSGSESNCGPYTGLWRSSDAGGSWTRIDTIATSGLPNGVTEAVLGRGALYWSAGDASQSNNYAYVAYTRADTNEITHWRTDENFKGLYRSSDGGLTWERTLDSTARIPYGLQGRDSCDVLNKQGGYNLYLAGNPARPNEVYLGGIDVLRSTDYGQSFTDITRSYSDYYITGNREQHSDQHGLAVTAGENGIDLLVVSDGGVFNTTDFGSRWKQLPGLPITMFYGIEPWAAGMADLGSVVQPSDLRLYGGTQDNGTVAKGLTDDPEFVWINHGDGGIAQSHPTDKEKLISSLQLGKIFARNSIDSLTTVTPIRDAGSRHAAWHTITKTLLGGVVTDTSEPAAFIAPVVLDKQRPTELYTARLHVYKGIIDWADLDHVKWLEWSPVIAGDPANPDRWYYGDIETIALGVRDPQGRPMLWAGGYIYQAPSSSVWRTTYDPNRPDTVAPTWIKVNNGLPGTTISSIVPDRSDSLTAFITTMGSSATDDKHVLTTTNGGATWTNVSGNLPHAPVSRVVIDTVAEGGDPALKNHCLIAATDVGVYVTTDGGYHWNALGDGMPHVVVEDVQIYKNLLIAATHGRSLYSIDISGLHAAIAGVPEAQAVQNAHVYPSPVHRGESVTIDAAVHGSVELASEAAGAVLSLAAVPAAGSRSTIEIPRTTPAGAYVLRFTDATGVVQTARVVVLP